MKEYLARMDELDLLNKILKKAEAIHEVDVPDTDKIQD